MMSVEVASELIRYAIERSGRRQEELLGRFPKLPDWLARKAEPTLRQLENFAAATYTPFGYFFLSVPPEERLPIPDLRTRRPETIRRPSGNLLDTIYLCQQRQAWFEDFAREEGLEPVGLVGLVSRQTPPFEAAQKLCGAIGFTAEERGKCFSWSEALRRFIQCVEDAGILVMVSGVVGSNTHRKLDPEEFCGFALADPLAPLIFINGADTKAAQMFTLAHELAHILLGQSALSDATPSVFPDQAIERWCNEVAAELLVPLEDLKGQLEPGENWQHAASRLARHFKVSTLVILRRLHEAGAFRTRQEFWSAYQKEWERVRDLVPSANGGDFYRTLGARVSRRFEHAIVSSALSGRTTLTEAMRLLGFRRLGTFDTLVRKLGFSY